MLDMWPGVVNAEFRGVSSKAHVEILQNIYSVSYQKA